MRWSSLLDVLFPPACIGCDAPGSALCDFCRPGPGARQLFALGPVRCVALGEYDGALRRAVLAVKSGRRDVADALAELLAPVVLEAAGAAGLVVPVPTTRRRRSQRGFDQAALLAQGAGRRCGVAVVTALSQTSPDAQHGRSRIERLAARGRFRCVGASLLAGASVLLLDDVATTGATLQDCAATLSRSGVRVAGALVVARAREGRASPTR